MATSDNIIEMEPIGYVITVPTAAILSGKNARAWVSMVAEVEKYLLGHIACVYLNFESLPYGVLFNYYYVHCFCIFQPNISKCLNFYL